MHFVDAKGILSAHNGMNLYRGCTHGCIYCDSRSKCYHIEHDFDDIEVKQNAPELLKAKLRSKRRKCMIGTGSMCDPYMHCEKQLELTRQCLKIIDDFGFGVAVQTKSDLILRDMDLLSSINAHSKTVVQMTLTTADEDLCRILEPAVCTTRRRFEVLLRMKDAGIPTVVWICPLLPFINDTAENMSALLDMCLKAGVRGIINFGMGVTLREGSREYFYAQLDRYFPGMKERYIRTFGNSYELSSPDSRKLYQQFNTFCREHDIMSNPDEIFQWMGTYPAEKQSNCPPGQLSLF